jgi:hypothetical protein
MENLNIKDYVKTNLVDSKLETLQLIADETGVPYNTLLRIKYQEDVNPRIDTIQPIYSFFKSKEVA